MGQRMTSDSTGQQLSAKIGVLRARGGLSTYHSQIKAPGSLDYIEPAIVADDFAHVQA
jgi:hypothetical protein